MNLDQKIKNARRLIRHSLKDGDMKHTAICWTGGKDSTVVLHLVREACEGFVPCKVFFNDSTMEFDEIYKFIGQIKDFWGLDLICQKHLESDLEKFYELAYAKEGLEFSRLMKVNALNFAIEKYKLKHLLIGIRLDECDARSHETYFVQKENHRRTHPILDFTEKDIWEYIKKFKVPYCELYDRGFRSLGEKPFTEKSKEGQGERSGREPGKEKMMGKLRDIGYY